MIKYTVSEAKNVELDDLVVPTIIELNEKGFITAMSCEGHLTETEQAVPYIGFQKDVDIGFLLEEFKKLKLYGIIVTSNTLENGLKCIYFDFGFLSGGLKKSYKYYTFNHFKIELWDKIFEIVNKI